MLLFADGSADVGPLTGWKRTLLSGKDVKTRKKEIHSLVLNGAASIQAWRMSFVGGFIWIKINPSVRPSWAKQLTENRQAWTENLVFTGVFVQRASVYSLVASDLVGVISTVQKIKKNKLK